MKQVTFIGGGNMARALAQGLRRTMPATVIHVVEPSTAQHNGLQGVADRIVLAPDRQLVAGSDLVVLAVKPQSMATACAALTPCLAGELVLSIAAGTPIEQIARWLGGHRRIARSMPNTPALVGQGMAGLFVPATLQAHDADRAEALLAACGQVMRVDSEAALDAITAVSGSGPAYVFHWIEAMTTAAENVGFSPEDASRLVLATLRGALALAEQSDESPATLRERVTSKGGTTAAALDVLTQRAVTSAYVAAVAAARRRAEELARFPQD